MPSTERLTPKQIICVHEWAQIYTSDAIFQAQPGGGYLYRGRVKADEHPMVLRDRAYHVRNPRAGS